MKYDLVIEYDRIDFIESISEKLYNGKGKNMLGKLLMRKRQELFNNLEPDDAGDFYFDY